MAGPSRRHHPVARHLGDDGGRGDRQRPAVALDHGFRREREKRPAGTSRPSNRALSGATARPVTASRIAVRLARKMSCIDRFGAEARDRRQAQARHDLVMQLSRTFAPSASWNRSGRPAPNSGSRMTAAATTGPASGPRPASSTPATCRWPAPASRASRTGNRDERACRARRKAARGNREAFRGRHRAARHTTKLGSRTPDSLDARPCYAQAFGGDGLGLRG
jgi:hypothetical protein